MRDDRLLNIIIKTLKNCDHSGIVDIAVYFALFLLIQGITFLFGEDNQEIFFVRSLKARSVFKK